MKRTAIYMRVSTASQVNDGQSLEAQRHNLISYIESHPDLVLVGEYMDEGVSGAKFDQRDELQKMLNEVKNGNIDLILFTKLDRFFRSVRHLMNTLDTLERCGCEWKAIQENHDNTSPVGKLSITIMGAFAQMESDMDSERIKDVMRHKRSKREWLNWKAPFGYKLEGKHAVPDPETADIARGLFYHYIKYNSIAKLVRDHLQYGAPTTTKGMKKLLTNTAYIGEYNGEPGYLEPLIDTETFERVGLLLSRNVKNNSKRVYIFGGLMRCPKCGRRMSGSTDSKTEYKKYRCNFARIGKCDYRKMPGESTVERFLLSTYQEDLEKRYLRLKEVKRTDNSSQISALYRKIDRLKDLYVNDLIDLETYKEDLDRYKREIKSLDRPAETDTETIEKLLKLNVLEIYKTLSEAQKRRLWGSVIRSITPTDDGFFVDYI